MNKVEKLADTISGEKVEFIKPIPLHHSDGIPDYCPEMFLDDSLIEEFENNDNEFHDSRIGKWSDFRNSLTKKDLSRIGDFFE